jgi:hypothetical protein
MGLTADTSTAAIAPFNFAQALFRYDGTLLTLPARHAANLLWYQSSFLRLCAAAAPKPCSVPELVFEALGGKLRASRAEFGKWFRVAQHRNRTARIWNGDSEYQILRSSGSIAIGTAR